MSTRSFSERAAAVLLLAASLACGRARETPEAYAARIAVVRYNQALVEAFRASSAARLSGVASEAEISRNAAVMAGLAQQELFMESRQTAFRVDATRFGPSGRAEIDATESWTYEHRRLADRGRPVAARKVEYHLTYRLSRTGDGWTVDQVVTR